MGDSKGASGWATLLAQEENLNELKAHIKRAIVKVQVADLAKTVIAVHDPALRYVPPVALPTAQSSRSHTVPLIDCTFAALASRTELMLAARVSYQASHASAWLFNALCN